MVGALRTDNGARRLARGVELNEGEERGVGRFIGNEALASVVEALALYMRTPGDHLYFIYRGCRRATPRPRIHTLSIYFNKSEGNTASWTYMYVPRPHARVLSDHIYTASILNTSRIFARYNQSTK